MAGVKREILEATQNRLQQAEILLTACHVMPWVIEENPNAALAWKRKVDAFLAESPIKEVPDDAGDQS